MGARPSSSPVRIKTPPNRGRKDFPCYRKVPILCIVNINSSNPRWRNWLARKTVKFTDNLEAGGSSPPRGVVGIFLPPHDQLLDGDNLHLCAIRSEIETAIEGRVLNDATLRP